MSKGNAPFNGPSTTGNPSGRGRGNNPPSGEDDDYLGEGIERDPFEGYADAAANSHNRYIDEQVRREAIRRDEMRLFGERMWLSTITREVKAADIERFDSYELCEEANRLALFIRTCRAEMGEVQAERVAEEVCSLRGHRQMSVDSLSRKHDPLMDAAQKLLTLADWIRYYDKQFQNHVGHPKWLHCRSLILQNDAVTNTDPDPDP